MKKILLTFIFLSSFILAQNGYNITVTNNSPDSLHAFLSLYRGTRSNFVSIDSIDIEPFGKKSFVTSKRILGSVYRIHSDDSKSNFMDVVIDNNTQLTLICDNNIWNQASTNHPLNKLYFESQKIITDTEKKAIYKKLQTTYPSSVVSLVTKIQEIIMKNTPEKDSEKELFRNSFFKNIDLDDKRMKLTPNLYQLLNKFTSIYAPPTNEEYDKNVAILFKNQTCKSRNYELYMDWVLKNYNYYSRFNLSQSYKNTFEKYINTVECMETLDKLYQKALREYTDLDFTPVGSTIPEVELIDMNENKLLLSDLYSKEKLTFVLFYDPDCHHCQEKTPEIVSFFELLEKEEKYKVEKIAFFNAYNRDETKWKTFVDEYKLQDWDNVMGVTDEYVKKLRVPSNPAFFVLDKEGKILTKNFIEQEIKLLYRQQH